MARLLDKVHIQGFNCILCSLFCHFDCETFGVIREAAGGYSIWFQNSLLLFVLLLLGFHTRFLFRYYWSHFCNVPWLITLSELILAYMPSDSEEDKIVRKTVMRYLLATNVLCYARIHPAMHRIWSNLSMSVSQGLLTQDEANNIDSIRFEDAKPFIPLTWATNLITKAECDGRISNHDGAVRIVSEIRRTYKFLVHLLWMDRVKIPRIYRMLISLMVYTYVANMVISRQSAKDTVEFYIPYFTIVEITILLGWLKISIILSRSMKEYDDSFDLTEFLDYNWKIGNHIIDGNVVEHPVLTKDLLFSSGIFSLNLQPKENQYGSNLTLNHLTPRQETRSKSTQETSEVLSIFDNKDGIAELPHSSGSQQIPTALPTISELPETEGCEEQTKTPDSTKTSHKQIDTSEKESEPNVTKPESVPIKIDSPQASDNECQDYEIHRIISD